MNTDRPDPDILLSRIKAQSQRQGLLKIFLGMSAGVGKTYAMLMEARRLRERGEDVVAGWIEPHLRPETEALARGLETLPPRTVEYRGIRLRELDLEAALARRPAVMLVDELAHTNAPGLTHAKRYQDTLELLDAGISVYTTVNIQHLESLADLAEEISGARVAERVPDTFFDRADEIQLVDIPPEELIERLREGKIYTASQSREAVERFFKFENLALLRELALRQAAELTGRRAASRVSSVKRPLAADIRRRILAAVSASPNSESLIRAARRFADGLRVDWTCVHVETGRILSAGDKDLLTGNLTLARNLGATVMILPGNDAVTSTLEYARQNDISILVVGKSSNDARRRLLGKRSLATRFLEESGRIAVIAVQEKAPQSPLRGRIKKRIDASRFSQYLISLAAVLLVTLLNAAVTSFTGYWSAAVIYLAAISFLGFLVERTPLMVAATVSALLWNFLFIPPVFTFIIAKSEDVFGFLFYFVLALCSSWMTSRARRNKRMLDARERRLRLQAELAEKLEGSNGVPETMAAGIDFVKRAFDAPAIIYLRQAPGGSMTDAPVLSGIDADEKERAAANYCFTKGTAAGRFTGTLPRAAFHYVPMAAPGGTIGVLGVNPGTGRTWTDEEESFLLSLASTISLAVQREILYARNREHLRLQESERLSRVLLNSISHELKTPLTVIKGSASELLEQKSARDKNTREELARQIVSGAERLQRLVEDLLSMSRLESGALQLRIVPSDPLDIVSLALEQAKGDLGERDVRVAAPDSLPLIPCDLVLVIQVLANLLRNAGQYATPGAGVEVAIETTEREMVFQVTDGGPGVGEEELPHLFEKFFRGRTARREGTGLGLSICKGIVDAHGGSIAACNRPGRGLSVRFGLPLAADASQGGAQP